MYIVGNNLVYVFKIIEYNILKFLSIILKNSLEIF
jgi:hypothetical protein